MASGFVLIAPRAFTSKRSRAAFTRSGAWPRRSAPPWAARSADQTIAPNGFSASLTSSGPSADWQPKQDLSYAVQHCLQNGGNEAYIVRVPKNGAVSAALKLRDNVKIGAYVLQLSALSTGTWSNDLTADVDYDGIPYA